MAQEEDKKTTTTNTTTSTSTSGNANSGNSESYVSIMTQKLQEALGKPLPDAQRSAEGQEEERPSTRFPWSFGNDNPGGFV